MLIGTLFTVGNVMRVLTQLGIDPPMSMCITSSTEEQRGPTWRTVKTVVVSIWTTPSAGGNSGCVIVVLHMKKSPFSICSHSVMPTYSRSSRG
jgi:hypothetical protein